jgi:hypothetical protein
MAHDFLAFEQNVCLRASGYPQDGDPFEQVIKHLRDFLTDLPAGVTAPEVDADDKRAVADLVTYSEDNIVVVEYSLDFTLKVTVDADAAWDSACEAVRETGDNPDDIMVSVAESVARDRISAAIRQYDVHTDGVITYIGYE